MKPFLLIAFAFSIFAISSESAPPPKIKALGWADPIWINDDGVITTSGVFPNTNPILIGETGALILGPNTEAGWGGFHPKDGIIMLHDPQNGDSHELRVSISTVHDVNDYSVYGEWLLETYTNGVSSKVTGYDAVGGLAEIEQLVGGGTESTLRMRVSGNPVVTISPGVGSGIVPFSFSSAFPLSDEANLLELQNGGENRFTVSPSGSVTIAGATNQVTFGATNTPPASTAAPTKWISVQVSGEPTVYRLPLYE